MKRVISGALMALMVLVMAVGCIPQPQKCDVRKVVLNTGYNCMKDDGSVLTCGMTDGRWLVIQDPSSSTTEPRPAVVVDRGVSNWKSPEPGSTYIGPNTICNASTSSPVGTYQYRYCFCVDDPDVAKLGQLLFRADNEATVYLNDTVIHQTNGGGSFQDNVPQQINYAGKLKKGTNCLTVVVHNFNYPSGFMLKGTLATRSCCGGGCGGFVGDTEPIKDPVIVTTVQ